MMVGMNTRAVVTVNGTEIGMQERETAVVVVPFGFDWGVLRAALIDGGFDIRSEWIDSTGTLTATVNA